MLIIKPCSENFNDGKSFRSRRVDEIDTARGRDRIGRGIRTLETSNQSVVFFPWQIFMFIPCPLTTCIIMSSSSCLIFHWFEQASSDIAVTIHNGCQRYFGLRWFANHRSVLAFCHSFHKLHQPWNKRFSDMNVSPAFEPMRLLGTQLGAKCAASREKKPLDRAN